LPANLLIGAVRLISQGLTLAHPFIRQEWKVFSVRPGVVKATHSSSARDLSPNKISSQNRVLGPLPTKKNP
jgi:hypothetical protein